MQPGCQIVAAIVLAFLLTGCVVDAIPYPPVAYPGSDKGLVEAQCPDGSLPLFCWPQPCTGDITNYCPNHEGATCVADTCSGCYCRCFENGIEVTFNCVGQVAEHTGGSQYDSQPSRPQGFPDPRVQMPHVIPSSTKGDLEANAYRYSYRGQNGYATDRKPYLESYNANAGRKTPATYSQTSNWEGMKDTYSYSSPHAPKASTSHDPHVQLAMEYPPPDNGYQSDTDMADHRLMENYQRRVEEETADRAYKPYTTEFKDSYRYKTYGNAETGGDANAQAPYYMNRLPSQKNSDMYGRGNAVATNENRKGGGVRVAGAGYRQPSYYEREDQLDTYAQRAKPASQPVYQEGVPETRSYYYYPNRLSSIRQHKK